MLIPYTNQSGDLDLPTVDVEAIKSKLGQREFSFVTIRDIPGQEGFRSIFFYGKLVNAFPVMVELKLKAGLNVCKVTVKSQNKGLSEACKLAVVKILM